MKNMFLLAGTVTLSFALLLVWMDNALANRLERSGSGNPIPRPKETVRELTLPEITVYPNRENLVTLPLPEVVITARKCKGA